MAKNQNKKKGKKEYSASHIKKIEIEKLKNAWDFEVFGLCNPTGLSISACCS